jgi:hypothetical protein
VKTLIRALAWTVLAALLAFIAVVIAALHALTPRADEWRTSLALGPWQREASVPTLLRWGTHPLVLPQLDGHTLAFGGGRWQMKHRADGSLEAICAPCRIPFGALGSEPVSLPHVRITLMPRGADRFDGMLWLGVGKTALALPWRAELSADGLRMHTELATTPLAQVVALFAAEVPEAARARIDGSITVKLDAMLGEDGLKLTRIQPKLADVNVAGLGTEALLDADPGQRCRPQPAGGRIEGWIQNAVMAAEDARFTEHPGYELDAWVQVWKSNQQQPDTLQGASTITQQLAKILYTGDERSAARKLREWLYAVEMERTLGKGRILQLYLAVLPWGDGICGAEAAARHHLGKPVNQLKPREAAWLASLLINPDLQLRKWAQDDAAVREPARERVAAVIKGMRRLPRERRESEIDALSGWQPPIGRRLPAPHEARIAPQVTAALR